MNPFLDWGMIRFAIKENANKNSKVVANSLVRNGNTFIPLHLIPYDEDINKLQAIFNKYVKPHLLDVYILRKEVMIEIPETHPKNEINKLLPIIHAVLFNIKPEAYTRIVGLSKEDLFFVKLLYSYFKSSPYYHTPLQANHEFDYSPSLPDRIFTVMKYFNPRTLRFLVIKNAKRKKPLIIPVMLPKFSEVSKIIPSKAYYTFHTYPVLISPEHLIMFINEILNNDKIPENSVASSYLSLSMWGVDATFQFSRKASSAILQLNFPRGESFKTIPLTSTITLKKPPEKPNLILYKNAILLHYNHNNKTLIFKSNSKIYETKINKKPTISKESIILPTTNGDIVIEPEEHYYNELMIELLKNTT